MSKPIHIFKAGKHTAMSGATLAFSESDLQATARAYDPALHEAPLVVGHPQHDAPAYGWVKSLAYAESGLHADPDQVDAQFAELVDAGRYKKISAAFYPPESPSNPVPGVYYLRHVGFLGAQPPAIKGLKQAEFADADDCVTIEFSEYDDLTVAGLFRGLREWLIGKFGADEADNVVPQYAVQQLEQSAQQEIMEDATEGEASPQPAFSESTHGDVMSDQDKARLAELEAENTRLKQQQADFAEQQRKDKVAADHAANLSFAEGLIREGRLLPAQKDLVVSTLDFMAGQEQVVEFGEGAAKKPLLEAVKSDLFGKLPKQIEFGEIAGGQGDETVTDADDDLAHKAKWAASPALRAEFGEFETYAAFARAEANGLVKIKGN
ncbi:hypothetical protein NP603_13945 [Methylomonas sp. SURF-1]|uniref:Peptidase n=1 Tax=Methylomonas aurea TaxID=2952224 RepID=A0ABT1UIZ9_9GAMM|nr:hypothetical protein [Methylomonas sp. SURF-1]MCQ8182220.1 hypothetical protein [Methylomonas sp. SURF-1]